MNDPPRLLDQAETSRSALELLRALDPPAAPSPVVQAALAKQLSTMVVASGSTAALGTLWIKATFVAVVALGGAGALIASRSGETTPAVSAPQQTTAPLAALEPAALPAHSAAPELPSPSSAPAVAARSSAASAPRDVLAEEEALLEAARSALSRDPARALSLLQRHRSRFPSGQLSAERMFLSVDCYQRLGNGAAAKREAAALAKRFPSSTYARRAPQLLGSSE
jgi:hypothetical protein